MLPVDELRRYQEQRLLPALAAWEGARKNLKDAIALAETREQEYRQIGEDVQRRLSALQLVIGMTQELDEARGTGVKEESRSTIAAVTPLDNQSAQSDRPLHNGLARVSSRRLFPANWRSSAADTGVKTA
jgi:hypothetical protein